MSKDFLDIDGDGDLDFVDAEIWGVDDDYTSDLNPEEDEKEDEESEDFKEDAVELEISFDSSDDEEDFIDNEPKEEDIYYMAEQLIDAYSSELKEDYEDKFVSYSEIINETYEFNPERAKKYYEWGLNYPKLKEYIERDKNKDLLENLAYEIIAEPVIVIVSKIMDKSWEETIDNKPYLYLKNNYELVVKLFKDIMWKDIGILEDFFLYLIGFVDDNYTISVYETFLKYNKTNKRDLSLFWTRIIKQMVGISEEKTTEFDNYYISTQLCSYIKQQAEMLGEYGKPIKKALKRLEED